MKYLFTAAAERVLNHAAGWLEPAEFLELDHRALLLGLLTETECRAARILEKHGATVQGVCGKWGMIEHCRCTSPKAPNASHHFCRELNHAIREAHCFASEFERTPILATEHLLLALLYGDSEVSRWLLEHGADRQALEVDIRARIGYVDTPLEFEENGEGEMKGEGGRGKAEEEENPLPTYEPSLSLDPSVENPLSSFPLPPFFIPLLRIFDAAANRAREGLRVVEDYLRFVLDDRFLTETAKQLRHDLVAAIKRIPQADLLAARETQADVGTGLTTDTEAGRADLSEVLAANFGRIEESLRSLEEYGKLIDATTGARFKQIRYRIYTLQRAVEITRQSCERLAAARLYVLIDCRGSLDEFRTFAAALIASGVHVLQLRDKKLSDRQLLERACALRKLTCGTPTLFIVNDRPDLAVLSRADGVHLGQEELSVKDARTIVGPQMLVGISTHSIEQARQAALDGANYIGVGPTFPSTTKQFAEFPGVELLRAVATEIRLPAFAIGGITLENLPDVLAAGIRRVAVSGAITKSGNPQGISEDFIKTIMATN